MDTTWIDAALAVFGAIVGYAVRYITAHPDIASKVSRMVDIAGIVVRAVEQIASVEGAKIPKKEEALNRLAAFAETHGLHLTEEELDTLIEAAVLKMKQAGEEIVKAVAPSSGAASIASVSPATTQ